MILNQYNINQCLNRVFTGLIIAKRYRKYKPKWAINTGDKTPCDHALLFFDKYYPATYANNWPSVRLALLSLSKHCALVNNFSLNAKSNTYFQDIDAYDIIKLAHQTSLKSHKMIATIETDNDINSPTPAQLIASAETARDSRPMLPPSSDGDNALLIEVLGSERNRTASDDNLSAFMPVKKIVSQREVMRNLEEQQNIHQPAGDFNVTTITTWKLTVPSHLQAYTFDRGCIKVFKQAKPDAGGLLNYYLMDAASLLPVLALDLVPGCNVLDMCAAPGGKTVAMLQTLLPETVTCIDHSRSRLNRLKEVLSLYVPKSYVNSKKVNVLHGCAIHFGHEAGGKLSYDRVLVDVPCFADRHALHNKDNNMFRPSRLEERLQIQNTQRDLLVAGLLACKPGGSVVYSTCTLSMAQNDSVVRQALEQVWLKHSFDVAVVDTTPLVSAFSDVFTFHKCQLGHLVLPNVTANFGPMYFCKLQRLN